MDQNTLWREYTALSMEARQQVEEFIAFLLARSAKANAAKPRKKRPLMDEPFVGMWRDREDMADSAAWVKSLREREWSHDPACHEK